MTFNSGFTFSLLENSLTLTGFRSRSNRAQVVLEGADSTADSLTGFTWSPGETVALFSDGSTLTATVAKEDSLSVDYDPPTYLAGLFAQVGSRAIFGTLGAGESGFLGSLRSDGGSFNAEATLAQPNSASEVFLSTWQVEGSTPFRQFSVAVLGAPNLDTRAAVFDPGAYLVANSDVKAAVAGGVFTSGWDHFVQFGQHEGREGTLFNEAYYLGAHSDVAAAVAAGTFASGFQHFAQFGAAEGRDGWSVYFDEADYLAANPDLTEAALTAAGFANATEHWLYAGISEGRSGQGAEGLDLYYQNDGSGITGVFDEAYYLGAHSDVAAAVAAGTFASGEAHYLDFGRFEGRTATGDWLSLDPTVS